MHRLYRESTRFIDGVHVKDISKLNRNIDRIIVIDDDALSVSLQPDNLIRVKPYENPNDRQDRALENLTPLLIEIAKENYKDIPKILRQFKGLDADEIAVEYRKRIDGMRQDRAQQMTRGLGRFAGRPAPLPPPESSPAAPSAAAGGKGLTAKDLVGEVPPTEAESTGGVAGWYNARMKDKEEEQKVKMEKWQEVMLKKQQQREAAAGKA
jgi:hypothetical protein